MSDSREKVHMCKTSRLIAGRYDSCCTSRHLHGYHTTGFFFFFPSPLGPLVLLPRQGQLKETIPLHHKIYEIHTPVFSLFTEYIDSHQGASSVPGGLQSRSPSIGCHREHKPSSVSPVTGANWETNTGCIQSKPQSLSMAFCYHTGTDNLGHWHKDKNTKNHKITCQNTKKCDKTKQIWPGMTLKRHKCLFKCQGVDKCRTLTLSEVLTAAWECLQALRSKRYLWPLEESKIRFGKYSVLFHRKQH